jgi:hypothetical protein
MTGGMHRFRGARIRENLNHRISKNREKTGSTSPGDENTTHPWIGKGPQPHLRGWESPDSAPHVRGNIRNSISSHGDHGGITEGVPAGGAGGIPLRGPPHQVPVESFSPFGRSSPGLHQPHGPHSTVAGERRYPLGSLAPLPPPDPPHYNVGEHSDPLCNPCPPSIPCFSEGNVSRARGGHSFPGGHVVHGPGFPGSLLPGPVPAPGGRAPGKRWEADGTPVS